MTDVPPPLDNHAANASRRVSDTSRGPWMAWKGLSRHGRAIRFIETYCVAPKGHTAGKLLTLAPFQKEWLEDTLCPGVNASVESIPRGNGKSTFKAALGLWATFDPGESGDPQVPIVATTVGQGMKTIFNPAVRMCELNPELGDRAKIYTAANDPRIVVPFTGGTMFPIADKPDGLQGLDPSLGICDEIGFLSIESWGSLVLATGKRPDSLIIAIGTPGLNQDSALWNVRQGFLSGERGVRYTEFAADDGCSIRDELQWAKANPAFVAGFKSRSAFEVALSLPESLFRIFQLGQWCFGTESWLGTDGLALWTGLADPWDFVPGGDTWAAVDMSRSRDCSAVVALQKRGDGRLHCKEQIWYPTPGGTIDGTDVMNHIRMLDREYNLVACGFDPRFFDERAGMLKAERVEMVEFPQSLERMTPACGEVYERIKTTKTLSHDGKQEFQNHILNAVAQFNSERGFTLKKDKPESLRKIDAAVALCMAVKMTQIPPKRKTGLYIG